MSSAIAWFWDNWHTVAALVIFAGTYFVMALGKLPGYRLDRAGAALLGAAISDYSDRLLGQRFRGSKSYQAASASL